MKRFVFPALVLGAMAFFAALALPSTASAQVEEARAHIDGMV